MEGSGTVIRDRIADVSKWTYNLVGIYEAGGVTARLAYNERSSYPEGGLVEDCPSCPVFTRQGRGRGTSRLDWSSSYAFNDNLTVFFDWTNILRKPFKSDIVRVDYSARTNGIETRREIFPLVVRFEESILTGGIRFRFGGVGRRAAEPAPAVLPPSPPPPVVEPAPVIEQPAPPPPPLPSGERG